MPPRWSETPSHDSYDVVIIGGAMMGSASAWFLTDLAEFDGSVLVIDRDPSFAKSSTAHTNSCIRQQFSTALNVQISQFTAAFITSLRDRMGDARVPDLAIQNFGYLYLAGTDSGAEVLRANHAVQRAAGAGTRLLTPDEMHMHFPFLNVDDLCLGAHNTRDEGYWDGGTVFEWFRRSAMARGVEYLSGEVTRLTRQGDRISHVVLADGRQIACGHVVNAAGPRAARIATMAGIDLPVEPRKRFTWVFEAERPLDRDLPLTVDPAGVHVRTDGRQTYMAGCAPEHDHAVDPNDFTIDANRWLDHAWPIIATRIPQFDALRIVSEWAGHYAYNVLDQNAVLGPHPYVANLIFQNGFSGHGLQQAPAMGRGVAEWITYGAYRSLDLSPFAFDRILSGRPILERAVI
ncbi:MAG: FAD-binding oxidoreductase [Rhodobacteraceae bacterium]|nr:FAD-binding oxidoreductase [Paracoccaceae bacterium]